MYFRADKKNSKNVSLYEEISYDKEGNKITIMDVLKTDDIDYIDNIYKYYVKYLFDSFVQST